MNNENEFDYKPLTPFKWFVLQNFPYIDADFDAITNYQLFCKLGEEINKIIDSENVLGEQVENVTNAFNDLKSYVDNYFENLDVQDEIDKKIDEMVEDGTFTNLIKNYVDPLIDEQNEILNNAIEEQNENINLINNKVNAVTSGTPLGANSIDDMTNTERIYVLSTDGHWYFYNGEQWQDGGVYQAVVDYETEMANKLAFDTYKIQSNFSVTLIKGSNIGSSGGTSSNSARARTDRQIASPLNQVIYLDTELYLMNVYYYYSASGSWTVQYAEKNTGFTNKKYINSNMFPAFGISFKRVDNETITDEDISAIASALKFYKLTDETSSIQYAPADAKELGYSIEDYNNLQHNIFKAQNLNYVPNLSDGGINFDTGGTTSNSARCRTGRMSKDLRGIYVKLNNNNYKMRIGYYSSSSGDFSNSYEGTSHNLNWVNEITVLKDYYFVLAFKKSDDTNITSEDKTAIQNALEFYFLTDKTLTEENAPADAKTVGDLLHKSIKILGIGNSYTRDSIRWISKILLEVGYTNVIVGQGYWGGSTLKEQYDSLDENNENHSIYTYYKYNNSANATTTSNTSLDTIFEDEDWDVVIFQQQSDDAGQYSSFVSNEFDINDFISYVKNKIDNENIRIGITATWSHATGFVGEKFAQYYDSDPELQYQAIQNNIPIVANHMSQCDFIINSGLSINLGRENTYLGDLGNEMLRSDKTHLAYGIPSFMISFLYAYVICGITPDQLKWYPTLEDDSNISTATSNYLSFLAKQCDIISANTII